MRPLYWSEKIIKGNTHIIADKLMIVAHPDDELIFGGSELINEPGWLVICVTNGSNKSGNKFSRVKAESRIEEFTKVMNALKCKYEIWDFEDNGFNCNWGDGKFLKKRLNDLLKINFKKIVTHNLEGEYGHIQHKKISKIVHKIKPDNLFTFDYVSKIPNGDNKKHPLNENISYLLELLGNYSSQEAIVSKYLINILYQNIKKVD